MNEAVVLSTYETKLFLSLLLQFSFVLTSILLRIQSSVRVWDSRTVNILLGIQSSLRKMLMSFTESSLPVSLTESSVHEHSPENTELCKGVWLTSILLGIYRALSRECSWVLQRALYTSILLRMRVLVYRALCKTLCILIQRAVIQRELCILSHRERALYSHTERSRAFSRECS